MKLRAWEYLFGCSVAFFAILHVQGKHNQNPLQTFKSSLLKYLVALKFMSHLTLKLNFPVGNRSG